MWNFIARKCSQRAQASGESLPESEDGRQWIWLSYAKEFPPTGRRGRPCKAVLEPHDELVYCARPHMSLRVAILEP
jgi:hypothetical protein